METDRADTPSDSGIPDTAGRRAATAGLFLGPAAAALVWLLPPGNLTPQAHRLCAVGALVVVFWMTEAIPLPVTALLGVALAVLLGVAPAAEALASFGDPVVMLFIGSFMLAQALRKHGLDRRIAYGLLAHRWVAGSTRRVLWALGLTAWLLSMWISGTACVAMLCPVALAIGRAQAEGARGAGGAPAPDNYTKGLLLTLVFSVCAGSMATPVGTPPNLIGLGLIRDTLGVRIGFFQWMAFGLPAAVVMQAATFVVLTWFFPPEARQVRGESEAMRRQRDALGPWTQGERNSLAAFALAIALWIGPGLASLALGAGHPASQTAGARLHPGIGALLAAAALFLMPADWRRRQFTLGWADAARIDWGTVLLFGGGIALGRMMFESGLAGALGHAAIGAFGAQSPAAVTGVVLLTTAIISQFCSNTATAAMMAPLALALGPAAGLPAAIAATLGAGTAGMFPIGSPANAMVFGTGRLRMGDMAKPGLALCTIGCLVIWAAVVWVLPWVPLQGPAPVHDKPAAGVAPANGR